MKNADKIIYKEVLINAYKYGSAESKIVLQKIIANHPELRTFAKELFPKVKEVVQQINSYPKEKIEELAERDFPEDIIFEKKERDYLPELKDATKGKVKVRYPPEPSKHPHIGQMLSFCINHLIAQRFEGKTVLRFDDTNPEKVKLEFYDSFREAIKWMNLQLDEEVKASDFIHIYYQKAEELLQNNDAYVCLCTREQIAKLREQKKACKCNLNHSIEENMDLFSKMREGEFAPGEAIVRFRGDMQSLNSALRDPIILRISNHPHPIQGDKYRVWPMYDFESPIMEDITKVTHVLRSIEFGKMREELQSTIAKKLGLNVPHFFEYRRFNIIGAPTQGRIIRELVENKIVTGWDDYRLVTYQAMRRRGIQPEVFPELIKRVGATKSSTKIDWSLISSINRKIIEPKAKHFFFVPNPIKITIKNPIEQTIHIPLLPEQREVGERTILVYDTLYISDYDEVFLQPENKIRMKDLYNVKILRKVEEKNYEAEIIGKDLLPKVPRIQWVSEPIKVEIIKPEMLYLNNRINKDSLKLIQGFGEKDLKKLKSGDIIQLERFGFAKVNKITEKIKMNYIHG
ncbi:MAG: glutamate--tRNA ligase [Candidatus Heimdallarchaeaceae archaeon]